MAKQQLKMKIKLENKLGLLMISIILLVLFGSFIILYHFDVYDTVEDPLSMVIFIFATKSIGLGFLHLASHIYDNNFKTKRKDEIF